MNKYSTKRTNTNSHSFDSYNNKHRRDYSPTRSHSRNSSPDSWSPRGSYSSKYSRKSKDRDSKYYDGSSSSKNKYMRLSRSPVGSHESKSNIKSSSGGSSSGNSKDYLYDNGHSSSSSYSSKKYFGDWSEQISSSGKRYYYNSKTEVSQWQKPREWVEWEKRHSSSRYSSSLKHANHRDKYEIDSSQPKSYSYSNDTLNDSERIKDSYNSRHTSPISRSHHDRLKTVDKSRSMIIEEKKKNDSNSCVDIRTISMQSSNSHCNNNHKMDKLDSVKSVGNSNKNMVNEAPAVASTSTSEANISTIFSALASFVSTGQQLNLSKLFSQINAYGITSSNSLKNEETLNLLKKTVQLSQKSQQIYQNAKLAASLHQFNSFPNSQSKREHSNNKTSNFSSCRQLNSADGIRQDLDQFSKKFIQSSSTSTSSNTDSKAFNSNRHDAVTSGLTTISSINSSISQKSSVPSLSRFKHLYREDLVSHVMGWFSEQLEKQANALFDQANYIGNHTCTQVSAELKTTRSLVRLTEIQSTLQNQRFLFAGQQIKTVEEWRGKQFTNYS